MPLIKEIGFGTPRSKAENMVTLTIDGFPVTVPEATSIMRAAMAAGIKVPKFCATDWSRPRVLPAVPGRDPGPPGTPASCTPPVCRASWSRPQNERLKRLRRGVMELYISDHPLDCLTCAANGDCELQDMAGAVGLREVRYGFEARTTWMWPRTSSNPYFTSDPAKCIVCSRCVRACERCRAPSR